MSHRKLSEIVKGQVLLFVPPEASVAETVKKMQQHRFSAVPVLSDGVLAGVFTSSDFIRKVIDMGRDPKTTAVGEVMTQAPHCLAGSCLEIEAVRLMKDRNIRHVIVTGVGEVGFAIVTKDDFPACDLVACEEELEFENRLWEEL